MQNKNRVFYAFYIGFLLLITAGFLYLLKPFFTAIFWSVIFAVLFRPVYRFLLKKIPNYRNTSAIITLLCAILIAIIPISLIIGTATKEVVTLYGRIQSGELDLGLYADHVFQNLPAVVKDILERYQITSVLGLREKLLVVFNNASRLLANELVSLSQNTFSFIVSMGIMLYLLFFLLRDGTTIQANFKRLIPLSNTHKVHLFEKFITVVRATIKGSMLVAMVQGALGGFIFALLGIQGAMLWGIIMMFLSLLPAVGSAVLWFPVAVYFLVSGNYWEGGILIAYGIGVIGLADNLLRPALVGKDTKLPDYIILVSTLGGIMAFGINGFVVGPLLAALFFTFWDELPNAIGLLDSNKSDSPAAADTADNKAYTATKPNTPSTDQHK
ncbi:AI-2E family transporter [Pelistega europaea]|uniref:AI-2E family transporter n=1 Tax=Pelistega europaea TaxID=106147 RepID=A0A7Y4L8Q8_9BURK|nr:AI-2E family transporter [Pelistega europaea]NOL49055.1 AI-2E family transporter [Pelistega europaea]